MASFNGCSFRIRGDGTLFPAWDAREIIVLRQRAANDEQEKTLGADVQRIAIVAHLSQAELIALYDQTLEAGSLVLAFETHDAFLVNIDPVVLLTSRADRYEATLNMVRL